PVGVACSEGGVTVNIDVECDGLFAGKPAPTGGLCFCPKESGAYAGQSRHFPFFSYPVWIIQGFAESALIPIMLLPFV
ncbi:hypothetical protein, partial [Pseudomonas sp. VI4.1]|uniref:hypothetical protein n=1 Tax=Pseudomonas sp. VI4.1 TaxID=1941346 RepID=UPI001C4745D0